jgi:hypothetical protein
VTQLRDIDDHTKGVLRKIINAASCGAGATLNRLEVQGLLALPDVQDAMVEWAQNFQNKVDWVRRFQTKADLPPPVCYLPLTGPPPDTNLLGRCAQETYSTCSTCWSLQDRRTP